MMKNTSIASRWGWGKGFGGWAAREVVHRDICLNYPFLGKTVSLGARDWCFWSACGRLVY